MRSLGITLVNQSREGTRLRSNGGSTWGSTNVDVRRYVPHNRMIPMTPDTALGRSSRAQSQLTRRSINTHRL